MKKTNIYYRQFRGLLDIAITEHWKMIELVGIKISDFSSETFNLYVSYPVSQCKMKKIPGSLQHYWDIPEYSNGSTRHSKCLFLLPSHAVGDACYPYLVRDTSEVEERYKASTFYDREKILMTETIGNDFVEIVWSFDYGQPDKNGAWYYHIQEFWFGVRVNGKIIHREKELEKLININL